MNFDYQYVKPIFDSVNSTEVPLLTRGEAHITVISPPEFALLDTIGISIEEINHIALKLNIQSSKVKLVCLGKEDVIVGGLRQVVYQLIAESSDLVEIRRKIFQLYVTKVILATHHCWLYVKGRIY
ncbi:hypothetical protein BDF20DRAFT_811590 [Mycotypha africana]|uniref:uncharacterized protein n=1 Tax=Mycotypha africana TaxID=64632 RepID=UPI0022FFD704|nr:uncharacterized protein BDF20DRAFT_811590 [Mycotypha africana]KAI8991614.1 hypothetical protein BDF20DRAFT_811590 [Mycotypha africana]